MKKNDATKTRNTGREPGERSRAIRVLSAEDLAAVAGGGKMSASSGSTPW